MTRSRMTFAALSATLLLLAACGSNRLDRGLSGGALGAGLGAATGAATGGDAVDGAVLGGAAGTATGVLTSKKRINLGRPLWR
jgi:osmotically inducible lipoprotein OsmB